jgi:hypothetical protein
MADILRQPSTLSLTIVTALTLTVPLDRNSSLAPALDTAISFSAIAAVIDTAPITRSSTMRERLVGNTLFVFIYIR